MGHMDQQHQGVQSTHPTPTTMPFQVPDSFDDPMKESLRNPTTTALTSSSWPSMKLMATYSPIKQAASQSHPTSATHML